MKSKVLCIAFVLLAMTATAHANLIQNGSFEEQFQLWAYGVVDWYGGWPAKDGNISIDLNGTSPSWISQSFATVSGQWYQVNFWLSGNSDDGVPGVKTGYVSAGSVSSFPFSFDTTGHNIHGASALWVSESFLFNATGTITTLTFGSTTDGSYGPVIDLVSVERAANVPLPAATVLFAPGLVGLALIRRRLGN
jgi:choice-of-anchor C domain-containing protein